MSVELFKQIPSEDLVQVSQLTRQQRFQKGECFIRQGDIGNSLYIIVAGEVDVVVDGVGCVAKREVGSVIGEMALLSDSVRTASCVASSDLSVLQILREDFQNLMNEKPELAFGIMQVLIQRLEEASDRTLN